jgi:hypothetical protein
MVSVAFWSRRTKSPIPYILWQESTREAAEALARRTMHGVGDKTEWHVQPFNITMAFRRPASLDEEMRVADIRKARMSAFT